MSNEADEAPQSLQMKRALFADIDEALRSDDDDAPDIGRLASMQAMHKAAARKQNKKTLERQSGNVLSRSVSDSDLVTDPQAKSSHLEQLNAERPASSDPTVASDPPPISRHTFSGSPSKPTLDAAPSSSTTTTKATGKRKREPSVKQIPDQQQIFKGLHFYFFPNTDKHPARKMRIAKALEYGATWEKDFSDSVTHVVVDKSMDFALLKKFLKRDHLPANVVLVNEAYPAECLAFKTMLRPGLPQFKVKGYEMPSAAVSSSAESNRSLQLKPAGKSVRARSPETPVESRYVATPPPRGSPDNVDEDEGSPAASQPETIAKPTVQSTAELDAAIKQARDLQHIPLDMDDDDQASRPSSSEGPATDNENSGGEASLSIQKRTKLLNHQDKFSCMQKHTGSELTPNAPTIAILQQMADYYAQIGDEWRTRAYRKAISTLRRHPKKIWTREEALALPQIGDRLATKIEEIAFTNRLRRLDNAKAEPNDQLLQTFMGVYGAGFAQASKWVAAGFTTLDELLRKADLTPNQRVGIEHYADFASRIPRPEVERHGAIVRRELLKLDPKFEVIVGGSYRRGAATSGDIDCIITHADKGLAYIRTIVLERLVPLLFAKKFLVAELAATSREDGSKWHGASCLPLSTSSSTTTAKHPVSSPWRRIDLLLVPPEEMGAALIYFTGNDIFNRSMRLLASTKGMRLNQRGLYRDVLRGPGRVKVTEGTLVEGRSERRIFEVLGVPWREAGERIC